jgi:hypothetical protein
VSEYQEFNPKSSCVYQVTFHNSSRLLSFQRKGLSNQWPRVEAKKKLWSGIHCLKMSIWESKKRFRGASCPATPPRHSSFRTIKAILKQLRLNPGVKSVTSFQMDSAWQEYRFSLIIPVFLALFCSFVLHTLPAKKVDPREPPVIRSTIPYVGHLIGMALSGSRYFKKLQYVESPRK